MIRLENVSVAAGGKTLLKDFSLTVSVGKCLAVLGPNGIGKTTLLKAMAGLHPIDSGSVFLGGKDVGAMDFAELARVRIYLPQAFSAVCSATALEVVLFAGYTKSPGGFFGATDKECEEALAALKAVNASHLAGRDVLTLSGGEQRRVQFACLLYQDTPCVFLDEPSSMADPASVSLMAELTLSCRSSGKTVVVVTHDLNAAARLADTVTLVSAAGHETGPGSDMMTEEKLSACYGCRIRKLKDGGDVFYTWG